MNVSLNMFDTGSDNGATIGNVALAGLPGPEGSTSIKIEADATLFDGTKLRRAMLAFATALVAG